MTEGKSEDLPQKPRIRVIKEESVPNEFPRKEIRIGEQKEGVPLVFFNDGIFKDMMGHLREDLNNERGGFLIGYIKQDKTSIGVTGFISSTSSQNRSGVRFEFLHDDFIVLHRTIESRGRGEMVVGWVHSHPNIEPAPSEYDIFITQNFLLYWDSSV